MYLATFARRLIKVGALAENRARLGRAASKQDEAMFHFELTDEEREILSQILQNSLATLELEIQHTDHQEFKTLLKRRRDALRALLARMPQPLAAAA